jgi:hypothetical protein
MLPKLLYTSLPANPCPKLELLLHEFGLLVLIGGSQKLLHLCLDEPINVLENRDKKTQHKKKYQQVSWKRGNQLSFLLQQHGVQHAGRSNTVIVARCSGVGRRARAAVRRIDKNGQQKRVDGVTPIR